MHALRDVMRAPMGIGVALAVLLASALTRTRGLRPLVYASPLLLWLCAEVGRFDGQQRVNQKFDATSFIWASAVELRGLGGIAILLLATPVGAAVGKLVGAPRGALLGLAALGPFGIGLLTSSALVSHSLSVILAEPGLSADTRLEILRAVIVQSTWLLAAGTLGSITVSAMLAFALLHRGA